MIKSNLLIHHKFVLLPNFRKVYLLNTLKNYFKEEEIDYSGLIESEIYSEYILQQRQNYSDTFGLNQDTIDDLLDGNVDNYLNID